ncbi:hypothetical protein ABKN59_007451 [Abortiporus biennis]
MNFPGIINDTETQALYFHTPRKNRDTNNTSGSCCRQGKIAVDPWRSPLKLMDFSLRESMYRTITYEDRTSCCVYHSYFFRIPLILIK